MCENENAREREKKTSINDGRERISKQKRWFHTMTLLFDEQNQEKKMLLTEQKKNRKIVFFLLDDGKRK